jgi:hypothetical protein
MPIAARKPAALSAKAPAKGARAAVPPPGGGTAKPARKSAGAVAKAGDSAATRKAISLAVKHYVASNYHALVAGFFAQDDQLADLFARIDRNLDASEARTSRLLGA